MRIRFSCRGADDAVAKLASLLDNLLDSFYRIVIDYHICIIHRTGSIFLRHCGGAKAADAAAKGAEAEFDFQVPQDCGNLMPNSRAWYIVQMYVNVNTAGLSARGVHVFVPDIQMDAGAVTVLVPVSVDLSVLFP